MPKIKTVGTIPNFLSSKGEDRSAIDKVVNHIEKNQLIYKAAGLSLVMLFNGIGMDGTVLAADGYTNGIIDKEASIIYKDLVDIGKWLIIGKGGWEVISSVLKSDFETAKKNFIGYLIAYVCLLGLPYAFDKVDTMFTRFGGA